ncbi:hypothetical protein SAMN06265222_113122 [Neorhodopirellula lusitana]|uniref:Transposase n=1 Tax=Neorhodopirellula lusitana TaxID=445327 RepID=A0ABY1QHC0_9BACT|nr:hypothetical protein [Neorhodopirellula lusitana]SMP70776.1 hypothetical protein SAMN06265222_113122 [Neorhodopirellula lusitana]
MSYQTILDSLRPTLHPLWTQSLGVFSTQWRAGDWAIYRKSKRSTHPGRRAVEVKANRKGETYAYVVDKFWVVDEVLDDGTIVLRTARGKLHSISPDDRNLVRPSLWSRLRWTERFSAVQMNSPNPVSAG